MLLTTEVNKQTISSETIIPWARKTRSDSRSRRKDLEDLLLG
jgi:hypothetical protein